VTTVAQRTFPAAINEVIFIDRFPAYLYTTTVTPYSVLISNHLTPPSGRVFFRTPLLRSIKIVLRYLEPDVQMVRKILPGFTISKKELEYKMALFNNLRYSTICWQLPAVLITDRFE
jgi:hypothetical protein